MEKACSKCGVVKPFEKFHKRKRNKSGIGAHCNTCHSAHLRQWRKTTNYQYNRNQRYLANYGITLEQYESLLKQQKGCCAVCGSQSPKRKTIKHFCVDHDHSTGQVRGLLCDPCNRGLGLLGDNPQRILNLVHYLEEVMDASA